MLNATCAGCHREIAAEWRASFHAQSQVDPAYQRAFALEPLPFCQGCHAPETSAFAPVPAAAAELGVACVTCHVVGEHVLGSNAPARGPAPHSLTRSAELGTSKACAGCHEFAFPDAALRDRPELMQATVREHALSSARDVPCASCHLPFVGEGAARHRSHAFRGGHDAELVKGALRVRAERVAASRVRLVLSSQGVGHSFPTGDLFRRLEVSAEAVGSDYQVTGSARRYLARHWTEQRKLSAVVRSVSHDDRVTGAPLELELELDGSPGAQPIAWRVAYQRVEHPRSESERDNVVEGEIELARGVLPAWSKDEKNNERP